MTEAALFSPLAVPPGPVRSLSLRAHTSPQLMPRVIGLFAQQNLVPIEVMMSRNEHHLLIEIHQDGLDPHRAEVLLQKVRAIVGVEEAALDAFEPAGTDPCRTGLRLVRSWPAPSNGLA